MENEKQEFQQFLADALNSHFKGTPSERELADRLAAMCAKKNPWALRGLETAKMSSARGGNITNSIWATGAIHRMGSVAQSALNFND
jgi:hypothetical protein